MDEHGKKIRPNKVPEQVSDIVPAEPPPKRPRRENLEGKPPPNYDADRTAADKDLFYDAQDNKGEALGQTPFQKVSFI